MVVRKQRALRHMITAGSGGNAACSSYLGAKPTREERLRNDILCVKRDTEPYLVKHTPVFRLIPERQLRFFGMWHVRALNRITIGSLGRRSDRPVIGGDLVDALVPAG